MRIRVLNCLLCCCKLSIQLFMQKLFTLVMNNIIQEGLDVWWTFSRLVELSWSKNFNNVWQTYLHRSVAPSILLSCSWKIQNYSKYCNLKTERWVTILIMLSVVMCDDILHHLRFPILFAWNISGYRGERCNIKHSKEKES